MLPPRDEVRPERNAQGAVAPHRAAFALPLRERLRARRGRRWIREQRVPRHDECRLFDHDLTCFHQRWSPFHGGVAASVAYEITRSLIFSSTQLKLSSLMENESKSGAGLRKSIA